MAYIEKAIRERLIANTNLTALVGQRIRPQTAAQNDSVPFVLFELEATEDFPSHSSACVSPQRDTYRFDIYAESVKECRDIARQINVQLQYWKGISNDCKIGYCGRNTASDSPIEALAGSERAIYVYSLTYVILWNEEE